MVAAVDDGVRLIELDEQLVPRSDRLVGWSAFPQTVAHLEPNRPRWIWADTTAIYPQLLAAGVRVERCLDLRMCHAILRISSQTTDSELAQAPVSPWDRHLEPSDDGPNLLEFLHPAAAINGEETLAEHQRQQTAVREAADPSRVRTLLAAESAGALIAAELNFDGLPWSVEVHDQQLTALLGPRPIHGGRPAKLESLATEIRQLLQAPGLNPDSPHELLRSLRKAGVEAKTTRKWELENLDHPVIKPLLEYKKLSRLLSANGWFWMESWVREGRFHPDYVPAGVVTGRWATRGGGALQLPKQIRSAVVADPGWKLVVADAAQLEPRVLTAMARDLDMAKASRGLDLYQGLVDAGIVDTRAHAKVAMLGALYGATTGEAGQLMPRLMRAYPKAVGLVEEAARAGERGDQVSTWLGRTSPRPGESWQTVQQRAAQPEAGPADERRARQQARDWGRFTRNFIVQGTAAEWALVWMATLRQQLRAMSDHDQHPQLVYFLHDEVIVHTPDSLASQVETAIRTAAATAGELLFGTFPIEFATEVVTVADYGQAN